MKPLLTLLLLFLAPAVAFSQEKEKEKQKPKAVYQMGAAKVTVWENKTKDSARTFKTFKVEKVYKQGEEWKTTNSFNEKELLELKAVIEKTINEEAIKTKEPSKTK